MTAFYEDDAVRLYLGDCLAILPTLADASVDAVVTDAPYELGFMGKAWDASGIAYNVDVWRECLRVLKPGAHLVAFGAPRTYHRMAVAIEDAGFEIRDSLHWIYGSGMPKGQNIGKAIDKRRDDREQVLQVTRFLAAARTTAGLSHRQIDDAFSFNGMASHWTAIASKAAIVPTPEQWDRLRDLLGFDDTQIRPLVVELNGRKGEIGEAWSQREVIGQGHRVRGESDVQFAPVSTGAYDLTSPATDAAKQWNGWNTQLRPAHEPIVLARKSTGFNTTVANVLEHGTGALNVDATRIAHGPDVDLQARQRQQSPTAGMNGIGDSRFRADHEQATYNPAGRWPTNILVGHGPNCIDDGDCQPGCPVVEMAQSGVTPSNARASKGTGMGYHGADGERGAWTGGDSGGASRFFPVFRYEAVCELFERVDSCERVIGAAEKSQRPGQPQSTAAKVAQGSTLHDGGINNPSPKSSARTAESASPTMHQPNEGSAPGSVQAKPAGWSALRAASAGTLCDSCVTAIAQSAAATQRGLSGRRELGLPSTRDSSERILNRSLALIVEDLGNSGTISTTTDLTTSLGCVVAAIKTYTTREYPSVERRSGLPVLKYEAKAPKSERPRLADGTAMVTVKPLALMRWLVRLVTPPGGTVLDPFAGTGTTLEACRLESFQSIGIEKDPGHAELCKIRLAKPYMTDLFGGAA